MQKILILTPLDETNVYTNAAMTKILAEKCNVLSVPMYADYLLQNGIAKNEQEAIVFALASVKHWIEGVEKIGRDVIVIGNSSKDIHYDMIIGFNKQSLKLEPDIDLRLKKMQEQFIYSGELEQIVKDTYNEDDCESWLIDTEFTARFVLEYLDGVHNGGKPSDSMRIAKEHYGRA
jgi:hypothetical protein